MQASQDRQEEEGFVCLACPVSVFFFFKTTGKKPLVEEEMGKVWFANEE